MTFLSQEGKFTEGDTHRGISFARDPWWTSRESFLAWKMLLKYQNILLASLGMDMKAIPPPLEAQKYAIREMAPIIGLKDEKFTIRAPGMTVQMPESATLLDTEPIGSSWIMGSGLNQVEQLIFFAIDYHFEILPEALALMDKILREAEANFYLSEAKDAELVLPTLGGTLRPFQKAALAYIHKIRRVLVADDMGLGKTIEAISALETENAYPAVIVCPDHLKSVWKQEIQKWIPLRKLEILNSGAIQIPIGDYEPDIYLINYDILSKYLEYFKTLSLKGVVVDESHFVKSPDAKRTQATRILTKDIPLILLLTGTPIINRPKELITQLEILNRLEFFGGKEGFIKQYCNPKRRGRRGERDINGCANPEELNRKLREICMVRRLKKDVLTELPDKQQTVIPVSITNRREYNRAEKEFFAWIKEMRGDEASFRARKAEQIVQIECLKQLAAKGKLETVIQWITTFLESSDEKLVVFAHHREIIDLLLKAFPDISVTYRGEDAPESRTTAIERFQTDDTIRLFLGSMKTAGTGITLTAASNVAFVELGWTPAEHAQAEDRIHRIGQKNACNVWSFIAEDTIDQKIHELIEKKREVIGGVIDNEKSVLDEFLSSI